MHLACATDERYAPYCAAMLHSAIGSCRPARVDVHLLHPETLSAGSLARLRQLVEGGGGSFHASAINADSVASFAEDSYFPKTIWYRCFLPELRPELDRILYLDCDTLVTASLEPLWETPLDGCLVAAVQNLVSAKVAARQRELGFPADRPYFNSGVLLMNLALMRQENCTARLLASAREYGTRSVWPDQDALNRVLGPKCRWLHPRWNAQNSFFYWPQARDVFGEGPLGEAVREPAILHFEGPPEVKPWHYLSTHPWRERYFTHLRATPFPVPQLWGRTPGNVLRRHLPDGLIAAPAAIRRTLRGLLRRTRNRLC